LLVVVRVLSYLVVEVPVVIELEQRLLVDLVLQLFKLVQVVLLLFFLIVIQITVKTELHPILEHP
tara:strand:- start:623 stop:817 length:195 start_codon:yes stop_codon:yes gene_type:complete